MKRISFIRRRRFFLRAALLSVAVAALLPQAALARYNDPMPSRVDPFATSAISAEDAHGVSAGTGFVLSAADRAALDQATAGAVPIRADDFAPPRSITATAGNVPVRADDFAPPRNITVATTSTGTSVNWKQVSLFSALGLLAIIGVLMLALTANRRSTRVAHT